MLYSVLILLGILAVLYVAQLALRSYTNKTVSWETFQAAPKQQVSAPAPPSYVPPVEVERTVAPSGPNPPNAQGEPPKRLPETTAANDPLAEVNSETPIHDNLRHPENSFGPGVENNSTRLSVGGGLASNSVQGGVSNFSPEFAQNGGEFMQGISASDAFNTDSYATI
jgi:hypothetical protein